ARIPNFNKGRKFDRIFIQTPLLCELEEGKEYKLTFYYLLESETVKTFGIQFLDTISIVNKKWEFRDAIPDEEIELNPKHYLTWQKAEITYTAKGGEQAILVGNFKSDENTELSIVRKKDKKKKKNKYSYPSRIMIWLDEFSLIPVDGETPCSNMEENKIAIYRDSVRHFHAPIMMVRDIERNKPVFEEVAEVFPKEELVIEEAIPVKEETKILEEKPFTLENINFETNSATLLPEAYPSLDELYLYLSENISKMLTITGHTDNVGKEQANLILSRRRAESVAKVLVGKGISPSRIRSGGKGESEPLVDNSSSEGREKNRRVEFRLM
ncbi:MAG: OmpA family protein, partial [Saprospiraceae bacterium]